MLSATFFASCKKGIQDKNSALSLGISYSVIKKTYNGTEAETNLLWIETFYYDKNNLLIQTTSGTKYTQFDATSKIVYHYSNDSRPSKIEYYTKPGLTGHFQKLSDTTYLFAAGQIKTKIIHDFEDNVTAIAELSYDNNRLIKEDIKRSLPGYYHLWYEYQHDSDGKIIRKEMYNDLGLWQTHLYEYNNGKLSKENITYRGPETNIIEYTYDGDNLIRVEKFAQYGSGQIVPFAVYEYFYTDSGRIKKEIRRDSRVSFDPPIFKYVITYEYRPVYH